MDWFRGDPDAPRLRRWLVGVLVALACLAILVSALAIWAHTLVFDTDRWVEVVAPVGKDAEATQAASVYLTDKAIEATDLEARIGEALPPRAAFLAAPLTDEVRSFLQARVLNLLEDPRTYDLWLELNRRAHQRLVAVLRGESTFVQLEGDQVQLNLLPLIAEAIVRVQEILPQALDERLTIPTLDPSASPDEMRAELSTALGRPLPPEFGTVVLYEDQSVSEVQDAVRLFDRFVWLIVIVALVLIAASLALSPRRLRTVVQLGVGTVAAVVIARLITARLEERLVDALTQKPGSGVARTVVTSAIDNLDGVTRWLLVAGIVVAVAAFLASRPHWFAKARDWGAVAAGAGEARVAALRSPAHRFIGAHRDGLQIAGVALALVVLFFATPPPWLTLLVLAVLVVYEVLVLRLAASGPVDGQAAGD